MRKIWYGVYYDRREPSFYTGFAPRTPDPRRLHLHVGRGNQLRVTAVPFARELRKVRVEHPFPGLTIAAGEVGAVPQ